MATATSSLNPAAATADAILTLINSRPQSPTRDELVAIISKAMPAPPGTGARDAYLKSDWHRIICAHLKAWHESKSDDVFGNRGAALAQRPLARHST